MAEKKMTPEELTGWLDDNGVPYEIDEAGRLAVKGDLAGKFRDWIRTREYTSLPDKLVCVEEDLWLQEVPITSLGNLTSVGGNLDLQGTPVTSLGRLTSVGGWFNLRETSITSLGNLTSVGGYLDLKKTPITSLGDLSSVGGWLDLWKVPVTSLDNLTSVGKFLNLQGTFITSLGSLASVGEWLNLRKTPITSLDDLPQVGGDLYLDESQLQLLTRGVLQEVGRKILCRKSSRDNWITLTSSELEAVIAENEEQENLRNTRKTGVDWDLYDR